MGEAARCIWTTATSPPRCALVLSAGRRGGCKARCREAWARLIRPRRRYNLAMELPAQFEANLKHALGDAGRLWVAGLPALLESCGRNYGLRIGRPFESMYNYVAPVTRADGSEAVLKLSPHGDDFRYELRATRAFGGRGMARILDSDEDRSIAILETPREISSRSASDSRSADRRCTTGWRPPVDATSMRNESIERPSVRLIARSDAPAP